MNVPTATSLKDIYPEDAIDAQKERWEHLLQAFKKEYGDLPEFVARSPGRVNLIGEVCLLCGKCLESENWDKIMKHCNYEEMYCVKIVSFNCCENGIASHRCKASRDRIMPQCKLLHSI